MGKFRVEMDEGCISCGICVSDCPEIFEMKDTAFVKSPDVDDSDCAKNAAENCPVSIIHVTNIMTKEKLI